MGIPSLIITGLVIEGAKLLPVAIYWWRKNRTVDPKLGLLIGAVAGAGFGFLQAQWVINSVFATGWNWQLVAKQGFIALYPFIVNFFIIATHIATTAFTGYGLARGFGWQYYLLAALYHAILNYSVLLFNAKIFNLVQMELFVVIWSALFSAFILWLRWRKPDKEESKKITKYWNKKSDKFNKLVK
jgi:RsiW-degrading membrane proteinase PrsW (M82 family)